MRFVYVALVVVVFLAVGCPIPAPAQAMAEGAPAPKVDAGPAQVASSQPVRFADGQGKVFAEYADGQLKIADGFTCADVAATAIATVTKLQQSTQPQPQSTQTQPPAPK